jgi:hypothetical protein
MAFIKRNDSSSEKPKVKEKNIEFSDFREQAIYAVKYLNEKYGEDIYDENRKPARHINLANNPNYVGNVGEETVEVLETTSNKSLLEFLKTNK